MANVGERTSLLHYGMDGNLRVNASGLCTIKLFTAVMNSVSLSMTRHNGIQYNGIQRNGFVCDTMQNDT
jgi:hypothetical protein